MKVMLGAAAMQALVDLPNCPKPGQLIILRADQILQTRGFGNELAGLLLRITKRGKDAKIKGEKIPWFSFSSDLL